MPKSSSSLPTPSLRLVPRSSDRTLGPLAVALAAGYGLVADDWQADIVECSLRRRSGGRYAAATVGNAVPRQNGKNGWLEIRELFGMVVLGEKFLHTAHEVKTARKAFRRILSFFENERQFPELFRLAKEIRKTNGQEAVILHSADCPEQGHDNKSCGCAGGGSVEFIARSSGSGRGFTVDVLVCDESQDLTDDELAALLPTISAAPLGNPQVLILGTPPDPEKAHLGKGEVFRRVRNDALSKSDKDLLFVDFGVPDGPLPDVDDKSLWYRHNPALGIRLGLGEVKRERKLMSPEKFAAERLGWWGDPKQAAGGIFGSRWATIGIKKGATPPKPAAIGLAVDIDEKWGSIAACGFWPDGRPNLGAVDRREGSDWLPAEAKRIQKEHGVAVVIDEKCPDTALIRALEDEGVDLTVATLDENIEACSELRNRVKTKQVTHTNTDWLNGAVLAAAWRFVGDRRLIGRKQSSENAEMLEAAVMALHGALQEINYDVMDSVL